MALLDSVLLCFGDHFYPSQIFNSGTAPVIKSRGQKWFHLCLLESMGERGSRNINRAADRFLLKRNNKIADIKNQNPCQEITSSIG